MRLIDLYKVIKSERHALRYLSKICRKNGHRICAYCRGRKVYQIPDKRFRCKRCKARFNLFTNRWYGRLNITASQWLWLIKLFELETSSRRIASEIKFSYPTALKATNLIRQAIATESNDYELLLKGEVEADESYFGGRRKGKRGRGAANKIPVFGILELNGVVSVDVVPNVGAETLLNMTIKKVRRGSIVYTDKFRCYDSLMFCGYRHLKIDHSKYFSSGKVYINGLEGFWSFAKERLMKYHGVSKEKFPYYLKELEYRYNNRNNNLFSLLTKILADFVPIVL
jgi:transposase